MQNRQIGPRGVYLSLLAAVAGLIPDAVTDQTVHTDLKVGHPPGKIGMFQKFAQPPMIDFSIP